MAGSRPIYPEAAIDRDSPPLRLNLTCNACGTKRRENFDWACVSPDRDPAGDWDRVVLSRVFVCKKCGTEDDYKLQTLELLGLRLRGIAADGPISQDGRVIHALNYLWDGTAMRRPSQALDHLRKLTQRAPPCGEAFRRLGNALERFGKLPEAIAPWRRACEIDPEDVEAAYSLANALWRDPATAPEGFGFLRTAFRNFPAAQRKNPDLRRFAPGLAGLLETVVGETQEPFSLAAAWSGGQVRGQPVMNLSTVDVDDIEDFERLGEFMLSDQLISLDFVAELADDKPTRLQLLLSGQDSLQDDVPRMARPWPVRAPIRVGRNDPCPCGSGKKYKKCCGR